MSENKFKIPQRHISRQRNVWLEYEELYQKYKPLNLAQNHPTFPPPKPITDLLSEVAKSPNCDLHQYTRDYGHPRLVSTLANLYSPLINRKIDPETEVLTTVGAYEALFSCIVGHVDTGDEVILIEPFFDCYVPMVDFAGGVTKFIPLKMKSDFSGDSSTSESWVLDKKELEDLFNEKTKIIILNNPNNPLGKVFKLEELELIANLCKKWNVLCISDEVFEWLVYESKRHIRIASLPGMWERTITIGSAGKSFNISGWRLGWAYGPSNLLHNLKMVHQNSVYTGNTPVQEVISIALERELNLPNPEESYFKKILQDLEQKKNYIVRCLKEVKLKPVVPDAGYFLMVEISSLASKVDLSSEDDAWKDYHFTKWMIKNVGLLGIPCSAFYGSEHKFLGEKFIRFCFFNETGILEDAAMILRDNFK